MRQKYIIQLWNRKYKHWFDYLVFFNRDNARRFYSRMKKITDKNVHMRLLEVISYDFKEY